MKSGKKILKKKKLNGFTLIELIVVIAIIGVLAAILIPTMMGRVKDARQKTANDAAAKIAEQAAIISSDMEAEGTTMVFGEGSIKYYGADSRPTLKVINDSATDDEKHFKSEMEKAIPNLSDAAWGVAFGENGSVIAATYIKKGDKYTGKYPDMSLSLPALPTNNDYSSYIQNALDQIIRKRGIS